MWASSSIVNLKSIGLKHLFTKTKGFGYIWFRNFLVVSLSAVENDNLVHENSSYSDNVGSQSASASFSDSGSWDDDIFSTGSYLGKSFDEYTNNVNCMDVERKNDCVKKIKDLLVKRGWIWHSENGFSVDLDQYTVSRILDDIFEETSDASLAYYFFRWSELSIGAEHSIMAISRMVHILVLGKMNYRAVDLLHRLVKRCRREERYWNLMLKVLFESRSDRWTLGTVFSMVVDCCIKERKVDMALKITYQMDQFGIFPSRGVCISLLQEILRYHGLELAWQFLDLMLSRGKHINVAAFSLFIEKYCSYGHFDKAWELLMEMKYHGIRADIVAFTIFIDKLCKAGFLREATSILFKLPLFGISPDFVSISSVIDGYCKLDNPEAAIKIINYFVLKPNIFVYSSFLSKLCVRGDMVKASIVFNEISEMGLVPDYVCYTNIISGYCKLGDTSKAYQYFGKLLKSGNPPSLTTYTLLIGSCCKSGNVTDAESLFQNMKTEGLMPDVVTYNTLMHGYGKTGRLNKVFELMDVMRSAGITPDVASYNIVIHSMVSRGYIHEAKSIIDELMRRGYLPDVITFTDLIGGFSRKGAFEEAFLVWSFMTDCKVKPDVVTCSALLHGYCREQHMDEAIMLFDKMLEAGLEPDQILYNTLIYGFCSMGDINKAFELVSSMVQKGIHPNDSTHKAFVVGFEKRGFRNPEKHASMSLQQILLGNGVIKSVS